MIASCRRGTVLAPQCQQHDRTGWLGLLVMFLSLENPRRLDDGRRVPSAVVVVALLGLYLDHVRVQYGVRSSVLVLLGEDPARHRCTNNEVRKYIERHEVLRMFWAIVTALYKRWPSGMFWDIRTRRLIKRQRRRLSSLLQCKFRRL
jgi:hypothetical protein